MESTGLDPGTITERIREAKARRDRALAEYQAAVEELEWWRQGQRLFGEPEAEDQVDDDVAQLFPPAWAFADGTEPTLRQAIVATMEKRPGRHWPVHDLVAALHRNDWLPEREDSTKRVSDMAGIMVKDGQLERVSRGVYILAPEVAAALAAARQRDRLKPDLSGGDSQEA